MTEIGLPTLSELKCACCKLPQDVNQFYKNTRYKSGYMSYCKTCMKEYGAKWDAANPTAKAITFRKSWLKRQYGITPEDWERMYITQGGKCAICCDEFGTPNVDHCHRTGRVRGLLCINCNHGLGKFQDDPSLLQAAIAYLGCSNGR